MAANSNDPRMPYIMPRGNEVPALTYGILEGNSQSFVAGNFVYLSSAAAVLYGGGDQTLFGIAAKDATNVSSGNIEIPIYAIGPDDVVSITVATSADVPEASNTTCALITNYDTNAGTTITSMIDSSDTTNACFRYQGPQYDADGTASNRGLFRLIATEVQTVISN